MRIWLIACVLLAISNDAIAQPVSICDDEGEWPPYVYYSRVDGKPDKSEVTGASVELMGEVFKLIDMKYSITLLPWKRCLMEVDKFGQNRKYEVVANGSFSKARADKYYVSTPIYKTHKGVFYSKKKFPKGPPIRKLSDLNEFDSICGVLGYNYGQYKLDPNKINLHSAPNMGAALQMLSSQRCDILLNSIESVFGGVAIGNYAIPPDVAHMAIPEIEPTTFHLFIAKSSPRGLELLKKVNKAIHILQSNGVSKKIFKKYIPED